MKLWNKKRLFKLFRTSSVANVLHGHVHRHHHYYRKDISFLNAGGTMFPNEYGHHVFHLLHVHKDGVEHTNIGAALPLHSIQRSVQRIHRSM